MELITIKELEKKIKVSNTTIYKFINQGMPVFKVCGKNLFDLNRVLEWMENISTKKG